MSSAAVAAKEIATEGLLRHAGPMRLVETVLSHDSRRVRTRTTVRATWPFVSARSASAVVCFELMTQSVAAYLSLMHASSGTPLTGTPVVTRIHELTLHADVLSVDDVLLTDGELDAGDHHMGIFKAQVSRDGILLAEGRFTVGQFERVHG